MSIELKTLKRLFMYTPEHGRFMRLCAVNNSTKSGDYAGTVHTQGHLQIRIAGKVYKAHQLAWLWMTDEWPTKPIRHVNGDKTDNRWKNLAERVPQRLPAFEKSIADAKARRAAERALKLENAPRVTHTRLAQLLSYDEHTGSFTRMVSVSPGTKIGDIAGTRQTSGIRLMVDGQLYAAQRLAYFYMTGEWPAGRVVHLNGDKHDNRWVNLELHLDSTRSLNTTGRPLPPGSLHATQPKAPRAPVRKSDEVSFL